MSLKISQANGFHTPAGLTQAYQSNITVAPFSDDFDNNTSAILQA